MYSEGVGIQNIMKIRTQEQLLDYLDQEMAWRKKELSTLRTNVEKSRSKLEATSVRSGIVLLYAHWEGFLKKASEAYLEYVISQKLKYKELSINFIAIAIKQKLQEFEQTNKATVHNQMIGFLLTNGEEQAYINKDNVIKTNSNLNSVVLREMMTAIGLDFSHYQTKSKLIDIQLLNYRNTIAHGQFLEIGLEEFLSLHHEVRTMLDMFKDDITVAANNSYYRR